MRIPTFTKLSLAFLGFASVAQTADVCRAFSLSGGGSIGSYEAGVVYGLNNNQDPSNVAWDVVSGVSAGAINSAGISLFTPDEGLKMSEWLVKTWSTLDNDKIYKEYPEGFIRAIEKEQSVFDDSPLVDLIQGFIDELGGPKRRLIVSAADVNTGNYVPFYENTPLDVLPHAVVASGSIPFIFPPQKIGDYVLMDGGTIWNVNLVSAADRCREIVDDDSKIIMDIVLCHDHEIHDEQDTGNAINNFLRWRQIHKYYKSMNDVIEFKRSRPNIQYRYLIMPSGKVASGIGEINFKQTNIQPMIELGKQDGKTAVGFGEGTMFNLLDEYMNQSDSFKTKYTFQTFVRNIIPSF